MSCLANQPSTTHARAGAGLLAVVMLLALLQRGPVASLGAVLPALHLTPATAGLLTAAPAVCIATAALSVPALARRLGLPQLITASIIVTAAGLALRALGGTSLLVAGSLVTYAGIATTGIALPAYLHTSRIHGVGRIIATYAATISAGVGLTAASTPPVAHTLGNGFALLLPVLAALAAAILWPQHTRPTPHDPAVEPPPRPHNARWMLRTPRCWLLAGFFGLQSCLSVALLSYEPALFRAAGIPAPQAGLLVAVTMLVSIATSLTLGARTNHARHQTPGLAVMTTAGLAGLAGVGYAPASVPWLWASLLGVGISVLSVALALPGLRATSNHDALALGALVQGIGYALAATGPLVLSLVTPTTGITVLATAGLAQLLLCHPVGHAHRIAPPRQAANPVNTTAG